MPRRPCAEHIEGRLIPDPTMTLIALGALGVALVSLLVGLVALLRTRRPPRVQTAPHSALHGSEAERLAALGAQLESVVRRLEAAESRGERSIQRIGVVRYNPFADTGS